MQMTDARKRAEEIVNKWYPFPPPTRGSWMLTKDKAEPISKEIEQALTAYAKKQTEKLEDKIAEYHNAYEGAKQRNHVLEAEKLKAEMNLLGYKGAFLEESDKLANLHHSYGVLNQEKQTLEAELNAIKLKAEPLVRALEGVTQKLDVDCRCQCQEMCSCYQGAVNSASLIVEQALEEYRK